MPDLVEDPPDEAGEAPDPDRLVTLRQAHVEGIVGGEWEALRKAAQRPGFPERVTEGSRGAHLFRPTVLAAWWAEKVERTAADRGRSS